MEFKQVKLPKAIHALYPNTILDMEMYNKKYYIFDILFLDGKDVRNKKMSERINDAIQVVNDTKSKKMIIKPYLSPYASPSSESASILANFKHLKKMYSKEMKTGEVDGIIFVPDAKYTSTVLKWKPEWLLSIDFKIKKLGDNQLALLTQKDTIYAPKLKPDVGITKVSPEDYRYYSDGDIVEFIFKNGKFVPMRLRKDKVKSNYITVINSNFQEILYPTNVEKILR